jgi:hypothetical protein
LNRTASKATERNASGTERKRSRSTKEHDDDRNEQTSPDRILDSIVLFVFSGYIAAMFHSDIFPRFFFVENSRYNAKSHRAKAPAA